MAYVDLPAKGSTDTFSSTDWTNIKDNFDVCVPAIFTTKGDIAVASASKAASRLAAGNDYEVLQSRAAATLGVEYSGAIGVMLESSTGRTLANDNNTWPTFPDVIFDTNGFYVHPTTDYDAISTTDNGISGVYLIGGSATFATNATGTRSAGFEGSINGHYDTRSAVSGAPTIISFSTIRELDASDYLYMNLYQNSGGLLDVTDLSLWAMRLR